MLRFLRIGDYTVISENDISCPDKLIQAIENYPDLSELGRGRVKVVKLNGEEFVIRQYVHGGILRGITGDRYLSQKRVINELSILLYLRKHSFPCPEPYCAVVKRGYLFKRLFLITKRIVNSRSFSSFLGETKGIRKAKSIYALARLLISLFNLGVFHPDFHLSNVLVGNSGSLFLLDFDRAKMKKMLRRGDLYRMILRLYRYARSLEKKGELYLEKKDKVFFLRACGRFLGYDIINEIEKKVKRVEMIQELGWFFESKLYGGKK